MYNPDYFGINNGWVCPQCHRTFAPHISECPYCNAERKTFATTEVNDTEWWQKYLKQSQTGQPVNDNPSTTTATSNPNIKVTAWNSTTTCEQKCEDCDKYEKSCFGGIETTPSKAIISHRKSPGIYYPSTLQEWFEVFNNGE